MLKQKEQEVRIKKAEAAIAEMEFKIEERKADIARMQDHIELQKQQIIEATEKLTQIKGND